MRYMSRWLRVWWWNHVLVPLWAAICRGDIVTMTSPSGAVKIHWCEGWCNTWGIDAHDLHVRGRGGTSELIEGLRVTEHALGEMGARTAQRELSGILRKMEEEF